MNILSGTIALSISFILYIYLYGLKVDYSVKYNVGFFFFPTILLAIAVGCFGYEYVQYYKKKFN
ncbi:hypothetical protein SAMN05518871_103355 [Psychrobacillus sp. OK028]|uniref:hypothetical protein n=1 Tax=Psychrobacillus sp. OK028 TaxID=1884359 RepID=UPI00088807DF|nr:hypothetical protein [Psychrobacillus sp. OK028]SDN12359.1 hypothetical protein SAMN05518871_103355 [Psychrobacillus sp. OK028]